MAEVGSTNQLPCHSQLKLRLNWADNNFAHANKISSFLTFNWQKKEHNGSDTRVLSMMSLLVETGHFALVGHFGLLLV